MTLPSFDGIEVGDTLPEYAKPPITRATLALFAGASHDHNPIHIDIDFAKSSGLDDVIAHGLLVMAYLGQALTSWVPQTAIRSFETKFVAMTYVGDAITCTGTVAEKWTEEGVDLLRLNLRACDQNGKVKLSGEAVVEAASRG